MGQNLLVLSRKRRTFSAITQNEQLTNEIFLRGKDILQDAYDQNQKSFILEFIYHEEYPASRPGQVLD